MRSRHRLKQRAMLLKQQAELRGTTPVQLAKKLETFLYEEGYVHAHITSKLVMSAATYRWEQ
jgi:hypothetical protein